MKVAVLMGGIGEERDLVAVERDAVYPPAVAGAQDEPAVCEDHGQDRDGPAEDRLDEPVRANQVHRVARRAGRGAGRRARRPGRWTGRANRPHHDGGRRNSGPARRRRGGFGRRRSRGRRSPGCLWPPPHSRPREGAWPDDNR